MKQDENLKIFLIDLIDKQKFRFCRTIKEKYIDIEREIKENTSFFNSEVSLAERIYCILNDIKNITVCPICEKKVVYRNYTLGYRKHCSSRCSQLDEKTKEKYKKTYNEKYGENVDCNFKLKDFYKKQKVILKERYGVENVSQIENVKNTKRITFQKNHGDIPHPLWGNTWYDFITPSGIKFKIQGYERFALPILINKYGECNILIDYKSIKNKIGEITYVENDKKYRYYPDFFIISENKIIEVKSKFTLEQHLDNLKNKMCECLNRGYKFEIIIFDYKGNDITHEQDIKRILKKIGAT